MASPPEPLTRDEVREVDRLAIEELGLPGVVLMENAGRGAAEVGLELLDGARSPRALILAGGGNNGGDGWVVARHLHSAGVGVQVATTVPAARTGGDAAVHRAVVERMRLRVVGIGDPEGIEVARAQHGRVDEELLVVDALLGTGFRGELREEAARAIRWANELGAGGARVLALDLPSGLDADLGTPAEPTVRAHITATFVAPKAGFGADTAGPFLGRVRVCSIGTPPELVRRVLDRRPA